MKTVTQSILCLALLVWGLDATAAAESAESTLPVVASQEATLPLSEPAIFVVVNSAMNLGDLTRERVVDLLTGRVTSLPSGERITLILAQSEAGELAVHELTARDTSRLLRGWKRLVFGSGGRSLPLMAASDGEAFDMLRRTPSGLLLLTHLDVARLPAELHAARMP